MRERRATGQSALGVSAAGRPELGPSVGRAESMHLEGTNGLLISLLRNRASWC